MMTAKSEPTGAQPPLEVDAGGILLDRPLLAGPRLAVIRRPNRSDWSLPKGHVEKDETLRAAAEREIKEETGYSAKYLGPAGAMTYDGSGGAPKSVTYFYFLRREDPPPSKELDGVAEVAWMTFDEARDRVTYPDLRDFLASLTPPPVPVRRRWWERLLRLGKGISNERLLSAINIYELEMLGLRSRPRGHNAAWSAARNDELDSRWWRTPADELLSLARARAAARRVDAAWDALHASQRFSLYELENDELTARAKALNAEVDSKLEGWRKSGALAALARTAGWPPRQLIAAQQIFDEHTTNVYVRLRMASHRIILAAILLALTILGLWLPIALGAFSTGPMVLRDAGLYWGVMLLGMFGAMLSLSLDSSKGEGARSRIYEFTTTRFAVPIARLAIGAGAAVVSVATVQAAVESTEPWMYLVAIPAGFSERLVRRSVETLASQAGG
jgi:8-oxo-dGTP pyrophosphatase MutT (NUDIX family)/uncharacterized membrane protein YiaA